MIYLREFRRLHPERGKGLPLFSLRTAAKICRPSLGGLQTRHIRNSQLVAGIAEPIMRMVH